MGRAGLCRPSLGIFSPLSCGGLSDLGTFGLGTFSAVPWCRYLCAVGESVKTRFFPVPTPLHGLC